MLSHDMLRAIVDEREREIKAELRRRGLLGPRLGLIRWHHRPTPRGPLAR
jgi:hypothetical protein